MYRWSVDINKETRGGARARDAFEPDGRGMLENRCMYYLRSHEINLYRPINGIFYTVYKKNSLANIFDITPENKKNDHL